MNGIKAPPGDYSSEYWFVRIDDISGVRTLLTSDTFQKDFGLHYAVKENDGKTNPHYHVFLKYKSRTKSTMCKYLRGLCPMLSGNKAFSFVGVPDDIEQKANVCRYMSKGESYGFTPTNPNVIFQLPYINVEKLHIEYWEKNKSYGIKTKSKEGVSDRYIREVKELVHKRTIKKPTFGDLTDLTLEVSRGKLNDHSAFAVIQALMYHYEPRGTETDFRTRMWSKFNPDR